MSDISEIKEKQETLEGITEDELQQLQDVEGSIFDHLEMKRHPKFGPGLNKFEADFLRAARYLESLGPDGEVHDDFLDDFENLEEEVSNFERMAQFLDMVGTERENDLAEILSSNAETLASFQNPTEDELARTQGFIEGAGNIGSFFRDAPEIGGALTQALQDSMDQEGGFDINAFAERVQAIRQSQAIAREERKRRRSKEFSFGATSGALAADLPIGFGVHTATKKALNRVGRLGLHPPKTGLGGKEAISGPAVKDVLAGTAGAFAIAKNQPSATAEDITKTSLLGGGVEAAIRAMKSSSTFIGDKMGKIAESFLDFAGDKATRILDAPARTWTRFLTDGTTKEQFGIDLLETGAIPGLPIKNLDEVFPVRVESLRRSTGENLGSIREQGANYVDKIRDALREANIDPRASPQDAELYRAMQELDLSFQFNWNNVRNNLIDDMELLELKGLKDEMGVPVRKNILPADRVDSPSGKVDQAIISKLARIEQMAEPILDIQTAIKRRSDWRLPPQTQFSRTDITEAGPEIQATEAIEAAIGSEIDRVISKALLLKAALGDDLSPKNIAEKFGEKWKELVRARSDIESKGGWIRVPVEIKEKFLQDFYTHQHLQKMYKTLAKAKRVLREADVATGTNNIISLRDFATGLGTGTVAGGSSGPLQGIALGIGGGLLSRYIRTNGMAPLSVASYKIGKKAEKISIRSANSAIPKTSLADLPEISPLFYALLISRGSPLNTHGWVLVKDPEYLAEIKRGVIDDDTIGSVEKAKILTDINKTGQVNFINLALADEKDQMSDSPGLMDFRRKLDQSFPDIPKDEMIKTLRNKEEKGFKEKIKIMERGY